MTKEEFAIIASALKTYYPRENLLPNGQAMELWYKQLMDIPYNLAEIAVNKWVASSKWPPTIADIREQATGIAQGEAKEWGEAWEDALRAIRLYGSYDELKALDSLDEITRKTVKHLGYRNLCFSDNIQNDRANFRMIYEREQERAKQSAQLPPRLKQLIADTKVKMIEGGSREE